MTGTIVVLGATGYTGDLVARALVAAGQTPVLAGRNATRLQALADELGGLPVRSADVTAPGTVADLVSAGDVLVTTVGPFLRYGRAAVEAAVARGAHYVDSTGEGPFVAEVFSRYGARAQDAGIAVLPAFGYDYVPGNLAGALTLARVRELGHEPLRVDIGYFTTGPSDAGSLSGGTRASLAAMVTRGGHGFHGGALVPERPAAHVLRLQAGGVLRRAVTVPASEQLTLPELEPSLREVNVGLGWFGPAAGLVSLASRAQPLLDVLPPVRRLLDSGLARLARGSSGGPDAASRSTQRTLVVAQARDRSGLPLAHVELVGPTPYELTADLMAWAAGRLSRGEVLGSGVLGPVQAFGLSDLTQACAQLGLQQT